MSPEKHKIPKSRAKLGKPGKPERRLYITAEVTLSAGSWESTPFVERLKAHPKLEFIGIRAQQKTLDYMEIQLVKLVKSMKLDDK